MQAAELMYSPDWDRKVRLSDEALAIGRRLGDPEALSMVLNMRFVTLLAPDTYRERSANAVEALAAAEQLTDPLARFFAYHWAGYACVEAGDIDAGAIVDGARARDRRTVPPADHALADPRRRGESGDHRRQARPRGPAHRGCPPDRSSTANRTHWPATRPNGPRSRSRLGSWGSSPRLLDQAVIANPGVPGFRATLALALSEGARPRGGAGDPRRSGRLELLRGCPMTSPGWPSCASTRTSARDSDDVDAAKTLYGLLEPWAEQIAFPAFGVWGPVSLYLGSLARVLGDRDDAERHLSSSAASSNRRRSSALASPSERPTARAGREQRVSEPTSGRAAERVKVAVLGGGCGGLAAAWELTATPALRQRFEVTVYQLGWQLGGKGASGRAPHETAGARGQRIEEHGLHIWFGFYEHAFRMLRGAYAESGLATGEDWWTVPFEKCDSICLYEQRARRHLGPAGDQPPAPRWRRTRPADRIPTPAPRPRDRAHDASARNRPADGARCQGKEAHPGRRRPQRVRGWPAAASILDQLAAEIDRFESAADVGRRRRCRAARPRRPPGRGTTAAGRARRRDRPFDRTAVAPGWRTPRGARGATDLGPREALARRSRAGRGVARRDRP